MYAIVRSGGRQHRVAVGDEVEVSRLAAGVGDSVQLPVLLLGDEGRLTTERAALDRASVTAEVLGHTKGPKIDVLRYRNKTGYRRRLGHRQSLTRLRVTGIETGAGR